MQNEKLKVANLSIRRNRNGSLFDFWSIVHLISGILFGWLMDPVVALILLILWEPFEIFILSPVLAKFGITFGFESAHNSLSDIFFDTIGVIIGWLILSSLIRPPFILFS